MPAVPYRLSDFDFALPPELIAQHPAPTRSESRLLHVTGERLENLAFRALTSLLAPGTLLVFNDTRVVKSRLEAVKPTGGHVELLLERVLGPASARFQFRASHAPRPGTTLALPGSLEARVVARDGRFVDLELPGIASVHDYLDAHAAMPLPPYIARPADADDEARYQTVYGRERGAVAAPTAGLHFDDAMLAALEAAGIERAFVTLHVGAGTFSPVDVEDLSRHAMHSEWYRITEATSRAIASARERGAAIVSVGTTTLRALESAAAHDGTVHAGDAETALFITPGYRFRVVDRLLTNFHLPRSTLLMLVSAFAGYRTIREAYAHAIAQRYRFFSYGDAMLLERTTHPSHD